MERPLSFQLWLGRYHREFCPDCNSRACVTQHVDYDECRVPRCANEATADDEFHCKRVGCCHGCACDRACDCFDECDCDCHHCEVIIPPQTLARSPPPKPTYQEQLVAAKNKERWWEKTPIYTPSGDSKTKRRRKAAATMSLSPRLSPVCHCHACVNRLDCPVTTLSSGQRVTRRPRECLRFAALGDDVFSTHYNNDDGRNRLLDQYFMSKAAAETQSESGKRVIEICDDDDSEDDSKESGENDDEKKKAGNKLL